MADASQSAGAGDAPLSWLMNDDVATLTFGDDLNDVGVAFLVDDGTTGLLKSRISQKSTRRLNFFSLPPMALIFVLASQMAL